MAAVVTRALMKRFGDRLAVDGVELEVPEGSVFGFLGPNGAGKTTTIRMVLGLIRPSAGAIEVFGQQMPADASWVLPQVGALVEGPAFYPFASGRRNLCRLDAAERGVRGGRQARVEAALARVGLSAAADKPVRAYSSGMKQRLALSAALLQPRRLLVLDEPTTGLDPQGTREVRNLIGSLAGEGITVLLSSHLLSEVEQLCSHVAVLHRGRILAQGPVETLRGTSQRLIAGVSDPIRAAAVLAGLEGVHDVTGLGGGEISVRLEGITVEECNRALVLAGIGVRGLSSGNKSLEEVYVALTGEGFDVA